MSQITDTSDYRVKNAKLQEEIQKPIMDVISTERFKKTIEEKAQLATLKANHHAELLRFGHSPKNRMNISEPITAKLSF